MKEQGKVLPKKITKRFKNAHTNESFNITTETNLRVLINGLSFLTLMNDYYNKVNGQYGSNLLFTYNAVSYSDWLYTFEDRIKFLIKLSQQDAVLAL